MMKDGTKEHEKEDINFHIAFKCGLRRGSKRGKCMGYI